VEPLRVNARLTIPPDELRVAFSRSGGPGGQNVNKVETRVELRFSVRDSAVLGEARRERLLERLASRLTKEGEIVLHASTSRHRARNLEDARERLATLLAEALRQERPRKATKPTRGSQERRLKEKKQRSETKRRRQRGRGFDD
jgi:ribosome-associated protein